MEEGHDTMQAKKRAIDDDTHIWGKPTPHLGGIHPPSVRNSGCTPEECLGYGLVAPVP